MRTKSVVRVYSGTGGRAGLCRESPRGQPEQSVAERRSAAAMAVNGALVAVLIPASVCLGFAAATISFTAWNIVVPLLLNGFGLPLANTRMATAPLVACAREP